MPDLPPTRTNGARPPQGTSEAFKHCVAFADAEGSVAAAGTCFDAMIREHRASLRRYCLSRTGSEAEAEDLFQASLTRAWSHRGTYDGHGSVLGWLFSIARNEHLESLRRGARRRALAGGFVNTHWSGALRCVPPSPDECRRKLDAEADALELRAAVEGLPETARAVVVLCDFEEYTHEEAATALGLPVGTVKSRLHRAHGVLAGHLRVDTKRGRHVGTRSE